MSAVELQNVQNDFSHEIIGAAVEVQRVLGTGLLETAYAAALEIELAEREIGFIRNVPFGAMYKGRPLGDVYMPASWWSNRSSSN